MKKENEDKVKAGLARAESLTPEQRRTIALKGANARWGKAVRATHKGNFREEFGIDVECYVLDDEQKTGVISQRGMGTALGLDPHSGASVHRFLQQSRIAPFVGVELFEKLSQPIVFQWSPPVANMGPPSKVNGYDVTILIDICKAIVSARDEKKLLARQENIAKQAQIIINASAKAGIKGLVYALAGYDATRAEVVAAFKFFVREEAREYEKEFPDQLYSEWYRLYDLPRPERNKPWKFKSLTVSHVYQPLARSNGKILELTRKTRAAGDDRRKKLHQFLSEVGVKALRTHLGQLLGIAQVSRDSAEYERHVSRVFGMQQELELDDE